MSYEIKAETGDRVEARFFTSKNTRRLSVELFQGEFESTYCMLTRNDTDQLIQLLLDIRRNWPNDKD